jgi:multidrug transporter EmrE-like cation transporter
MKSTGMTSIPAMVWLALGGSILTVGDIIFKFWIRDSSRIAYVLGLATYLLGLMCLVQSFKTQNMAVASAVFVLVNIGTLAVVSWLVFDERLSMTKIAGLGLAVVAVLILETAK